MPKTPDQLDLSKSQNILIQGPSGTGKTTLALQFPKPYLLDIDDNLGGAARGEHLNGVSYLWDTPYETADGKPIDVSTNTGKAQAEGRIRELFNEAMNNPDIETIIFDSATAWSGLIQGRILKETNKTKMEIQHWDMHGKIWVDTIAVAKAAPKRFILIGHEEMDKDELDGGFRRMLLMQGRKIQAALPGMFTDCWETFCEPKPNQAPIHKVRIKCDNRVTGLKASHPCSKPVLNATWDEIKALVGGLEE